MSGYGAAPRGETRRRSVRWLGLLGLPIVLGCKVLNPSHCGNQDGHETCRARGTGEYCSVCTAHMDGCVDAPPALDCRPSDAGTTSGPGDATTWSDETTGSGPTGETTWTTAPAASSGAEASTSTPGTAGVETSSTGSSEGVGDGSTTGSGGPAGTVSGAPTTDTSTSSATQGSGGTTGHAGTTTTGTTSGTTTKGEPPTGTTIGTGTATVTGSTSTTGTPGASATTGGGSSAGSSGAPQCGDGVAEGEEACDGVDLRGLNCPAFGYAGGMLGCSNCEFDDTLCCSLAGDDCSVLDDRCCGALSCNLVTQECG